MRVIAVKRTPDEALARALGLDFLGTMADEDRVLADSDFVSIHLPLVPGTVRHFDRERFGRIKRGAFLINIARGRIVDPEALHQALVSGHLAGAALDVMWNEPCDPADPLLALENVIVTPHIAAPTYESEKASARVVVENIRRVAAGRPPLHQVQIGDEA